MEQKVIGGIFKDPQDAVKAIEELKTHGYSLDDISVFAKHNDDAEYIEQKTDANVGENGDHRGENAGKGAGIGAGTGGLLGGLAGLALEAGLLAIPGIGPIAAAGPLAAGLTGAGLGAGGGGIVGALTGAGIPEDEAKNYDEHLKNGDILVLVDAKEASRSNVYKTFSTYRSQNSATYPADGTGL